MYTYLKNWKVFAKSDEKLVLSNCEEIEWNIELEIEYKKEDKKKECRDFILFKYSESDQQNIQSESLATWDTTKVKEMRDWISWVLDEYRTKWKDADFSKFSS